MKSIAALLAVLLAVALVPAGCKSNGKIFEEPQNTKRSRPHQEMLDFTTAVIEKDDEVYEYGRWLAEELFNRTPADRFYTKIDIHLDNLDAARTLYRQRLIIFSDQIEVKYGKFNDADHELLDKVEKLHNLCLECNGFVDTEYGEVRVDEANLVRPQCDEYLEMSNKLKSVYQLEMDRL